MGVYEVQELHPCQPELPVPSFPAAASSTLVLRTVTESTETRIDVGWQCRPANEHLASIPAQDPLPELPVPAGSVRHIVALDVLEAVLDEEAWLEAIMTALEPGGTATLRVPLVGPSAWLDALNLYRYAQDISGLGKPLQETKLKGWHRHYGPQELKSLFTRHGFDVMAVNREGNPLLEAVQLGALVWGGMIKRTPVVEDSVRSWREDREDQRRLVRLGPLSTRITIKVRKRI